VTLRLESSWTDRLPVLTVWTPCTPARHAYLKWHASGRCAPDAPIGRILSRILNVAVKQKRLAVNPCMAVEFPVSVKKSTRKPPYMSATGQAKIEIVAPSYARNIVVIISELGPRYKKELLPMKKEQVDLENGVVHIADSKTMNGIGDMPLTPDAREAFKRQMEETPGSEFLLPSPKAKAHKPYMTNLRKVWAATLKKAGGAVFCPLRASAYLRYQIECRRRRRSYGDADVETGRCGGVQAVQSGKAGNDARGVGQAGSASERAWSFEHTTGELIDFYAHF
jgi:integrase